ncbi:MAG: phage tail protein [Aphanocapsa lilacina HA4352-LM1]|jgi:phage tail-like protein|nr:phage tail protein [Aphanocapsa lilacina HA4352-LM1]
MPGEFLTSCKFYFEADGITDKMISEIRGLVAQSPVGGAEAVHGSSKSGAKARQVSPTTEKFTHVIAKLVATNDVDLYQWYELCNKNDAGGSSWKLNRKSASVTAYDQGGTMQARWEIINCYPCKYGGPDFGANSPQMATETIELVHEGIKRVL